MKSLQQRELGHGKDAACDSSSRISAHWQVSHGSLGAYQCQPLFPSCPSTSIYSLVSVQGCQSGAAVAYRQNACSTTLLAPSSQTAWCCTPQQLPATQERRRASEPVQTFRGDNHKAPGLEIDRRDTGCSVTPSGPNQRPHHCCNLLCKPQ